MINISKEYEMLFSVDLMLGQRYGRWANIKPPLVQRLVFSESAVK